MSQKKLSNSEKQQLKNRLKKFGLISFVVISSILNILFVVSLCVGCANTKKTDAYNYQGVVTTPVVQPYGAPLGYRVTATDINNSLPSNYEIYIDYPQYNTGDNFLPYVWQFDCLNEYPITEGTLDEYIYLPLYDFRGGVYALYLNVYYNYGSTRFGPSYISMGVSSVGKVIESPYGYNNRLAIYSSSLMNEITYYNSYIKYSLTDVTYIRNSVQQNVNDYSSRLLNFIRYIWYFLSTDTWTGNIHLDSSSILNANNYVLKNLTYEGLVGEDKNLSMVGISSQGVTTERYFYDVQGSFYYKGQLYNALVFYYEKVYKGDDSPFELYSGDINGSNIEHQKLLYKCNDSSYNNLFYLSGVALCNSPNLTDPSYYLNDNYQLFLYHVYSSEFTWSVFDSHQIFLNVFSSNQFNGKWTFDQGQFEFDIVFGYIYSNGYFNQYSFYQYITNSYVIPVIVDDNASIEDMFAQTYSWISFIIMSFIPLMSISILPGVTLGVFIIMPLLLGFVMVIVKLFKR